MWLERVIAFLIGKGHQVANSHVREVWGQELDSPETAVKKDLTSIRKADLIVAYLGSPPSPGVQMELGMALSFSKPIVVLADRESTIPYLVRGLHHLTDSFLIQLDDEQNLLTELGRVVDSVTRNE